MKQSKKMVRPLLSQSARKTLLRWVPGAVVAATFSMSAGCSLDSSSPRVRVAMPSQGNQQIAFGLGANTMSMNTPSAPASFYGFHCFALNVTGPGISPSPICANDPTAGRLGGFAPFSGGVVDVRVPAGPARMVELLGVMTGDGSCPRIADMTPDQDIPIGTFHLGATTVDVFEDKRVTIQAAYTNAASAVSRLDHCGPGGGGPMPFDFPGLAYWYDIPMESYATGTAMGTIADAGPHALPLTQGTPGFEPVLQPFAAGMPGALLDGTQQWASSIGSVALNAPGAMTVFAVSKTNAVALGGIISSVYGTQEVGLEMTAAGFAQAKVGSYIVTGVRPINDTTPHVLSLVWDGAVMYLFVDGVADGSLAAASPGLTGHTSNYFGKSFPGSFFSGQVAEAFGYLQVHGAPEREALECYLSRKYGAPMTGHGCP